MNYLINNYNNKKCKISKKSIKLHPKQRKLYYKKLNITKMDKVISKITKNAPNLFPEYVIYNNKQFIIELSNKIAQKINSQIITYKATNKLCFVEYLAVDCANQILKQDKVDVFQYIQKQYGYCALNKKECRVFPYLLCEKLLLLISQLHSTLASCANQIEFGAKFSGQDIACFSYANYYGLVKYNKNYAKIAYNSNINYKKCIFLFIDKLIKIRDKLTVCINYLKYISNKFHI